MIPDKSIVPDSITLHYMGPQQAPGLPAHAQESYIPLDIRASEQFQKDMKAQL